MASKNFSPFTAKRFDIYLQNQLNNNNEVIQTKGRLLHFTNIDTKKHGAVILKRGSLYFNLRNILVSRYQELLRGGEFNLNRIFSRKYLIFKNCF